MLAKLIFFQILGLPLLAWGGLTALILLLCAGLIGYLNGKGINKPPFISYQGHKIIAGLGLLLALIHGLLALIVRLF